MAVTDELTGLMNRRYIDEKLPNILLKSAEINEPVSVAMLDIDFFKKFNDTYGHQTGDVVLSETAKILMSFIRRNSDFAARYGGEEFLLCFPGVPLETCRSICERVRQRFENHVFKHDATELSITVSIGVASSVELENASQESIIELSDKRLYGAKSTGRNKVI
jgi:diguanylate cyclase (GGDEF)-like protein